jgi:2-polyprenyl-6-methoxyphenol hydroxylase-like FAD-dependent oxidoreductase
VRVLVSGAGVAGLTCAYWLRAAGHTPVVVERAAPGPQGGYGIDLSGSGYDVAGRMGILDRLAARQLRVDSVALVDAADRITARLDRPLAEKMLRGPYLGLMHSTLEEVLATTVEDTVEIRHRQSIGTLRQNDDDVLVAFADGTRERFDVVVGADGVHSHTRALAFGPEPRWARRLGFSMACYPVPDVAGCTDVRAHYTEPGRQTVLYPTDTVGTSVALFLYRSQRHGSIPRTERVARLRAAYRGAGWHTPELLAHAPAEPFLDELTQIELPAWHRGRVVLIGDACGALTLSSAQGASVAMAGGYLLAAALAAHPGAHTDAFAAYQARVRPYVAERQRRARRFTRGLVPATRAGRRAQRVLTRLVLRDAAAPLLRFGFGDVGSILPNPSHHPKERQR